MLPGLSAARLRDSLLTPAGPWQQVDALDSIDSTNAWSLRDPRPWRVVAAAEQSAGRGRRGRDWSSPPGTSVAISLTVPMAPDPAAWGWLPLLTGLATRDALQEVTGSSGFTVKWPNDVLARRSTGDRGDAGRRRAGDQHELSEPGEQHELSESGWGKICGILCEATGAGLVVAGVGVNVTVPAQGLPVPTATSLRLCGHEVAREDVVIALARAFAAWHGLWYAGSAGLPTLRQAYRRHCATLGAPVRIHLGIGAEQDVQGDLKVDAQERVVFGQALDVDDSGEIVIQTTEGVRRFSAGDVVHLRPFDRPDAHEHRDVQGRAHNA